MTHRLDRINHLLREELSSMIQRGVKDPRLGGLISVLDVMTSSDLRHAKVFVSVMGGDEEQAATMKVLAAAAGFFRRELARQLDLRRVPDLSFHLDKSIERGARLNQILDRISESRSEHS